MSTTGDDLCSEIQTPGNRWLQQSKHVVIRSSQKRMTQASGPIFCRLQKACSTMNHPGQQSVGETRKITQEFLGIFSIKNDP
jgi:hypothetical protein